MRRPTTNQAILAVCYTCCVTGVVTALTVKDFRPAMLGFAFAWLGAEYLDHREQVRR